MSKPAIVPRNILLPFIVLASCFAWWGLANNMTDPLVKAFTGIYPDMSNLESSFIQFAFYGAYFCLAIPGALIVRRFSYKVGVLMGLGIYIIGCFLFFPAGYLQNFQFFLISFFVLAGGLSILETAANPYIFSIGPAETATQRLNLAQSFNPVGSIVGTQICQIFILKRLEDNELSNLSALAEVNPEAQGQALKIVVTPYISVGIFLLLVWALIAFMKMPHASAHAETPDQQTHFGESVKALIANSHYVFAVIAQFFFVGVQISVWTFTVHYIPEQLGIADSEALKYHTVAIILFLIGRFVCTGLMSFVRPSTLLFIMASIAALLSLVVVFVGGETGVYALVGISACMSLMFPTIFGLGTEGLGEHTKIGGSGLIMAILGGALFPLLQGYLVDVAGVNISYLVPLVCFFVVGAFALFSMLGGNKALAAQSQS
ncbi:MAG: L-fucose:H+ symporter permease [Verrucomicrobiota bacterium]